ncbi:MAG: hypothetical protein GF317_00320 [Candidatus Lokiarchaeota archaeon]|nr:hypothetical protein [Candidatus Lokiarchaeota archaeon]
MTFTIFWAYDSFFIFIDFYLTGYDWFTTPSVWSFLIPHSTGAHYMLFGAILMLISIYTLIYAKKYSDFLPIVIYGLFFFIPAIIEIVYLVIFCKWIIYKPLITFSDYFPYLLGYIIAICITICLLVLFYIKKRRENNGVLIIK